MTPDGLHRRLADALDTDALIVDAATLVSCPSLGGDEDSAQLLVAELAERLGLRVELHEEDLEQLRAAPDFPGEEVERRSLRTVIATLPGAGNGPRLALNGHVDVVPPGAHGWSRPPFEAALTDGRLYGRGACDMKSGLVAALHAVAAVKRVLGAAPGDIVVQSVGGEEDGGVGTFAALRRDAGFLGCVIPEPTAGALVCATGGALTWRLRIIGRAAHACYRKNGLSALDRFLPIHTALMQLEQRLNTHVEHPLMQKLELPYPLSVGVVRAGEWSSTVPDQLVCEGRLGVPVGRSTSWARAAFEAAVAGAADEADAPPEVSWTGGQFAPAQTDTRDPMVALAQRCIAGVTGRPAPLAGVPYGADMRQFTARGIPTVLYGPGDIAHAHVADEFVPVDDVVRTARVLARIAATFSAPSQPAREAVDQVRLRNRS